MASAESIRITQESMRRLAERGRAAEVNVGQAERWASGLAGGVVALVGLKRGGLGGLALAALSAPFIYRGVTGHCGMYESLGVNTADGERGPMSSIPAQHGVRVEEAVTVGKPAAELYRFWRDFENLPRIMGHLEAVRVTGPESSHWVAKAPMGYKVEWDAVIHNEVEDQLIAWRSLEGSEVDTAGSVRFTPASGDRGTEVRVNLKYNPPGGKLGAAIARLFGEEPGRQVRDDLRRFKMLMEAGEIATVEGQPSGPR